MSELLDICKRVSEASHRGKPKGLSPVQASILRSLVAKAELGDTDGLEKEAPAMLRAIADYWERRRWEFQVTDLEDELQAHRIALGHSREEIEARLGALVADGAANSAQHLDGLDRMGAGTRPTGAAVAGEAASGNWEARRPWERALDLLTAAEEGSR